MDTKRNSPKCLAAVMVISFLWLGSDVFVGGLKPPQANNLVYASDEPERTLPASGSQRPSWRVISMEEGPSLGSMLAEAETVISLLEKEKSSLKNQLLQTENNLKELEAKLNDQLAALTKAKQEDEIKLASQKAELGIQDKEVSSLNKQLNAFGKSKLNEEKLKTSLAALEEEKSSLKKQLAQIENSLKEAEAKLNDQLAALAKAKKEMEAKFTLLGNERTSLKEQISALEKSKLDSENELKACLSKLREESILSKQAAAEKDNLIVFFNKETSASEKAKADFENKLRTELVALSQRNKENEEKLWSKISALTIQEANFRSEIDLLNKEKNKEKKEAEDKIKALKDEESSLQLSFEGQLASLNARISELNDKNKSLQNELQSKDEALNSSASAAEGARVTAEIQLRSEIASNNEKESKIKELQEKIATLEREAPDYREQVDLLNKARKEAESRVTYLIKTKEDLAAEYDKNLAALKDEARDVELKKEAEIKNKDAEAPKNISAVIEENPGFEDKPEPELEPAKPLKAEVKKPKIAAQRTQEEKAQQKLISGSVIEKNSVNKEILVDLVKADGVAEGQSMAVMRENEKIAELKVVKVLDSFTVTEALSENDFNAIELFDKVELSL
ncbi:MAG: hypothetical protein KKC39_00255 [Candidatus Omnitrophica bacterium]|nr:hypothetical protein [Candidatus Omnitrophota bacterium]MBU4303624.1 hypothetical protein [Candidatus Omnitrophota bacterium]MBU4467165.1 hypothetical protein [Candidatus Omnitrophota bacterium]MCG2708172.1 hypothetical protein [Candidatus Omnitrophota bacterium]